MEQDLAWARFLTGLHGSKARREVSFLVSGVVEYGAGLQLTEDKLVNIMEAAQARRLCPLSDHELYNPCGHTCRRCKRA